MTTTTATRLFKPATLPGRALATAWLNVSQAAGTDRYEPALYRSVAVEIHVKGVRLTSTDGQLLLTEFVPFALYDTGAPPELDEAPLAEIVAVDADKRAPGLMKHVLDQAKLFEAGELDDPPEITLSVASTATQAALSDELESLGLRIEITRERLTLDTFDGAYPNWRQLVIHAGTGTTAVEMVALSVMDLARLGRLRLMPAVRFLFRGSASAVYLEAAYSERHLTGVLIPYRPLDD